MFRVKLAEHVFEIEHRYADVERMCADYLTTEMPQCRICVTEAEIRQENARGQALSLGYLETLAVYRKVCEYLRQENVFLFHCSAIEMDGKAYLFTAPSGTGKSTHARLWRETFGDRVRFINDDKPLLRLKDGEITVFGTPWAGKDKLHSNTCAVVAGVVIIQQALENSIRKLEAREAFPLLLNQTHRATEAMGMKSTLDFVWELASLPVYNLNCTISKEAAMMSYNALME